MTRTVRHPRVRLGLERFSGLYIGALFVVTFGIWTPNLFLNIATLHVVADEQAITLMLGIAVLIPLVAGTFDLSVGAVVTFSAVISAWLQSAHHWTIAPAIAVTVAVSVLIGLLNGLFVVKLGVNSFIATLGMATVVAAVQQILTGNIQPLAPSSAAWTKIGTLSVGGFQIVVLYVLVVAFFAWWFLDHTPRGRYLYAIGANAEAARLSGVRVGSYIRMSLVLSAAISGVAGIFYSSTTGPSLTFGQALLLPAFAAAFLGSTQIRPGRFNVWGTVLAVYVLAIGVKGLQLVTGQQWMNTMFNGLALLGAVSFAVWRQRQAKDDRHQTTEVAPDPPGSGSSPDGAPEGCQLKGAYAAVANGVHGGRAEVGADADLSTFVSEEG